DRARPARGRDGPPAAPWDRCWRRSAPSDDHQALLPAAGGGSATGRRLAGLARGAAGGASRVAESRAAPYTIGVATVAFQMALAMLRLDSADPAAPVHQHAENESVAALLAVTATLSWLLP
ncbi:MAG TPA: hypothetical protein VM387_03810, partial [Gemmatimonadales bacterium]|nr:hypothetical protein [Gemmatimonadales bacterium]